MSEQEIRIGINGFGRIGRCVAKIAAEDPRIKVVAVNDLVEDVGNLSYLYNYDSTYGRARYPATPGEGSSLVVCDTPIQCFAEKKIVDVPWENLNVDIIIDSSGIRDNVQGSRDLVNEERVRKVIITHSPDEGVDMHAIMGVNDDQYDPDVHHTVSTTICDANAIAHVLKALDEEYGINSGFVTTLHPWLSYQNLVDGPVAHQQVPGAYWKDYSLGRSSIDNMIPKYTTAVTALRPVLPEIESALLGFSFRIPTQIVSIADLSIRLQRNLTVQELDEYFSERFSTSPYVTINHDALVGIDFMGQPHSAAIDARWYQVNSGDTVKIILWYDNEWGYSSRVIDLARKMAQAWC